MKVGAFVPVGTLNVNPEFAGTLGPTLEERGFESLWLAEHVVLFDDYDSKYPYADDGRFPGGGRTGLLEPLTALSFVAATTTTLRLGTGICLVGQRNPVYTAKQVADVDVLSGGRVDFGIGIGWLREEFDVVAMPFDHRGARSDEHIAVMKELWTQDESSFDGRYYTLPLCKMFPKPVQQPHPPIHVGGESDGALRRTARLGQGWFGFNRLPEQVPEALTRLDTALAAEGRTRDDIEISVSPYFNQVDVDMMKRYEDLGVDRVILLLFAFDRDGLLKAADDAVALRGRDEVSEGAALAIAAPMQGTVVSIAVAVGDGVKAGAPVAVLEAMKMEHVVTADAAGTVRAIHAVVGETVFPGDALVVIEEGAVADAVTETSTDVDLDAIRDDLAEVLHRQGLTRDEQRPAAVERRHKIGHRTVRENLADLCDPDSFEEYGSLVIAAQRSRRPVQELIEQTPADGLVGGIGFVNGGRCAVVSYDYTVLAGTQGQRNHAKKDRLFELVERLRLPVVLFAEGGGGRPGDTDASGVSGLDCRAFELFARLSGLVPLVGVVSGRCFAGNAALLGCCDVIIATEHSNIGMGGPAMIEGGGLGSYAPDDVGPVSVQAPNGVIDVTVRDDVEAVRVAKQYLAYFQGPIDEWECVDQRTLRSIIPENRLRVYDVHAVVEALADTGSVLELRPEFGVGIVTALVRIEGRPLGIIANNPTHLGGAIDSDGADKAARFMQLCDAFDLPVLFLCDTPGFMVGPEAEKTAQVRHFSRMFVVAASMTVPFFTIVLRKGYGLGAQSMAGGKLAAPIFTIAWPTGEFGGMGLEGAVQLGFRRELDAIEDPGERQAEYERLVARSYQAGKALNTATYFEIDDVIDPADSRRRIVNALRAAPPTPVRDGKKRPFIDTW